MVSYIGIALGGFLLIWTGLRNPTGKVLFFQLISGILIGLVVLDRLVPIYDLASVVALLPYLLAAATGTIIFNQTYVHPAEKNMVTMYFIVSIAALLAILFRSF
jgi:hypothetical protein